MTLGLRLDAALGMLGEEAARVRVTFTAAPRRARELAAAGLTGADGSAGSAGTAGSPPPGYVARVVRERPGELICAWFYEPQVTAVPEVHAAPQ